MAKLAEVHCSRIQFAPGDRILVKVRERLTSQQISKLRNSIERWAPGVPVLIMDLTRMEIEIEQAG